MSVCGRLLISQLTADDGAVNLSIVENDGNQEEELEMEECLEGEQNDMMNCCQPFHLITVSWAHVCHQHTNFPFW